MKLMKKITPVALATSMAVAGLAAPGMASAEVSASASVSNFYLWRGLDISAGAPQMSGSLDYSHESGAYAGIWASSEEAGTETDLYIGYGGEMGGISYDVSFWEYLYPSDNSLTPPGEKFSDSDLSEFVLGLGFGDFGFTVYFGNDTGGGDDYEYVTLDYTFGDFNVLYGTWMMDTATGSDDSHLTLSYAATDNFTFTVTKGMQDDEVTTAAGNAFGYDEDFLFHVAYSLPIDMK